MSDKVIAVRVYNGIHKNPDGTEVRMARCDVKYANGDIERGVPWETFPLDTDTIVYDCRAVNAFDIL